MDAASVASLIGSVGFPIVACIAMALYINTTVKDLTTALQNNTIVMEKILTRLEDQD